MKTFIGIDLGTTNSAICIYDGEDIKVLKSPEQTDVTPSAIFIDRRGNKFVGNRAYEAAPGNPDNTALLFKRLMGSSTMISFASSKTEKTPEECSAEILKTLYSYLPEDIRNNPDIGTVITIPAAFNQMQKDATVQAAQMAGIGKVALMQEPVAAVMSVMRSRKTDGTFLIFDFGGGTLDVAIAESMGGRVNLLANGGIQMCGGRDMDRAIFDNIVKPWLFATFDLPGDLSVNPKYKRLIRFANYAVEKAKIELSSKEEAKISMDETQIGVRDESDEEIYFDIVISRNDVNPLIEEKIMESVEAVRETLAKANLRPDDIKKIIFIGGPSNYKPLRDKVCAELGIAGSTDVNPMTAVAEGAALFAESIDWKSSDNSRKSSRGKLSSKGNLNLTFVYMARTPENQAKIVAKVASKIEPGTEFQIDSLDTGWTSGRIALTNGVSQSLPLIKNGENTFKVFVFDPTGGNIDLEENKIIICKTAATVDAIPATHSIGIAVREKIGGAQTLEYLVKEGDSLPKKGSLQFKAAETLRAGSNRVLNFSMWEGEILDPITDNRPIGTLKIKGTDFDEGIIAAGADLICDYEMLDSGEIRLEVSVPSIGASFPSQQNFYSRQDGQIDFATASEQLFDESEVLESRIDDIEDSGIDDPKLDEIRDKIDQVKDLTTESPDMERAQEAQEKLLSVKKTLAQVRKNHLQEIRQMELDSCSEFFDKNVRKYAKQSEADSFDALQRTASRSLSRRSRDFEETLDEMKKYNFIILWRQEWFVIDYFKRMVATPYNYIDQSQFAELVQQGDLCIKSGDIAQLRDIISNLYSIRISNSGVDDILADVNIVRG